MSAQESSSVSDAIIEAIAQQLSDCRSSITRRQDHIGRLEEELEDYRGELEEYREQEEQLLRFIEEHGLKEAVEEKLPDE